MGKRHAQYSDDLSFQAFDPGSSRVSRFRFGGRVFTKQLFGNGLLGMLKSRWIPFGTKSENRMAIRAAKPSDDI